MTRSSARRRGRSSTRSTRTARRRWRRRRRDAAARGLHAGAARRQARLRRRRVSVDGRPPLRLAQIAGYFLRLGTLGFGGPIALAAYMQRDLVERLGWITQEEYLEGLAVSQTLPGPLAAQLAMWLGYVRRGFLGAVAAAGAVILPPVLILSGLGARCVS